MNNLRKLREGAKLSMQQLANLVGISKSQVFCWEESTANPTLRNAYKVAAVLNVSVYEIWPPSIKIVEHTITVRKVVDGAAGGRG